MKSSVPRCKMKEVAEPGRQPVSGSSSWILALSAYPQGVPGGFLNYVIE